MTRFMQTVLLCLVVLSLSATIFAACGSSSTTEDESQSTLSNFDLNCGSSSCVN